MIPIEVSGSRLPVGSSASSSGGWLTNARATETRCCSPPESWSGIVVQLGREAGQAQDVRHLVADLAPPAAGDLQRVGDVLVDRAVRQQLVVLEDHAEVAPVVRDAAARDLRQVAAGDADLARGRLGLLDQQPHRRRLAGAGLRRRGRRTRPGWIVEARRRRGRRRRCRSASRRPRSRSPRPVAGGRGGARAVRGVASAGGARGCRSVAAIATAGGYRGRRPAPRKKSPAVQAVLAPA